MALQHYFRISSKFLDPLLNTVPLEVIKAMNKTVKQASNKGEIETSNKNCLFLIYKMLLPTWESRFPCRYDALLSPNL